VNFGRQSLENGGARRSLDGERREGGANGNGNGNGIHIEALASIVKGRLRALTGERRKDGGVKPYPGT